MTTPPPEDRLRRLAAWADRFADPSFSVGEWVPSTTGADGVIHLGWFERSEAAQEFVSEMYRLGWVYSFDWMAWLQTPEGHRLSSGPDPVATATTEDLARLLTAIIRGDRFSEGQLDGAFRSGILQAIARRAQTLIPAV